MAFFFYKQKPMAYEAKKNHYYEIIAWIIDYLHFLTVRIQDISFITKSTIQGGF